MLEKSQTVASSNIRIAKLGKAQGNFTSFCELCSQT